MCGIVRTSLLRLGFVLFFFNDTATTEIYTLSLHDALPISTSMLPLKSSRACVSAAPAIGRSTARAPVNSMLARVVSKWVLLGDRKSTRLNSSHLVISYAVFCLKKKKRKVPNTAENKNRHRD